MYHLGSVGVPVLGCLTAVAVVSSREGAVFPGGSLGAELLARPERAVHLEKAPTLACQLGGRGAGFGRDVKRSASSVYRQVASGAPELVAVGQLPFVGTGAKFGLELTGRGYRFEGNIVQLPYGPAATGPGLMWDEYPFPMPRGKSAFLCEEAKGVHVLQPGWYAFARGSKYVVGQVFVDAGDVPCAVYCASATRLQTASGAVLHFQGHDTADFGGACNSRRMAQTMGVACFLLLRPVVERESSGVTVSFGSVAKDGAVRGALGVPPGILRTQVSAGPVLGGLHMRSSDDVVVHFGCFRFEPAGGAVLHAGPCNLNFPLFEVSSTGGGKLDILHVQDAYAWDCVYDSD